MTANDNDERGLAILVQVRGSLRRFEKCIADLKATGALAQIQDAFDELASEARGKSPQELEHLLHIYGHAIAQSLETHGLSKEEAEHIASTVRLNLARALKQTSTVRFSLVLQRAVTEWRTAIKHAEENRAEVVRRRRAWLRLSAAGGALLFDSHRLMTIVPTPTFVSASIIASATWFFGGIDDLFKK